ncbi:hypothetical protein MA16_Dca010032 [Dendrobium catenatum]|uniref:Uncharacterized protein n=1 Tax=Dendrobium catenatum TaxID=906689 RepID=A0A2I0VJ23_9ASPA|nr:hypothetical protein MA16_Dca010032 [Dendrobium catenatum]
MRLILILTAELIHWSSNLWTTTSIARQSLDDDDLGTTTSRAHLGTAERNT